jgi:hypothetical protein
MSNDASAHMVRGCARPAMWREVRCARCRRAIVAMLPLISRPVPFLAERCANAVHPDGLEQLHRPLANAHHLCGHVSRVKPS